jgi:hypothetical protein
MAKAVDATPREIQQLFHLAGHGDLFDAISDMGARNKPKTPPSAEAGITNDPTLPAETKTTVLRVIEGLRAALPEREEQLPG